MYTIIFWLFVKAINRALLLFLFYIIIIIINYLHSQNTENVITFNLTFINLAVFKLLRFEFNLFA